MDEHLPDVNAVIDGLGGTSAVARLVGVRMPAVSNWRVLGRFPPSTFLAMDDALKRAGKTAPRSLWEALPGPKRKEILARDSA